jgi:acetoacetate decarboxylase
MIIVEYRTDEEEALELLLQGLELVEPATAAVIVSKYHFSTFGPYNEAILCLTGKWQGQVMSFLPNLFVTQEAPLIAGREIRGYAKKLAHIDLVQEHEQYMGMIERPKGNRIATAVMRRIHNVPPNAFKFPPILSLKVIPDAEQSELPALAQLVSCDFRVTPVVATDGMAEVWSGPGSLVYNTTRSLTRGTSWRSMRSFPAGTAGSTHSYRTARCSRRIEAELSLHRAHGAVFDCSPRAGS